MPIPISAFIGNAEADLDHASREMVFYSFMSTRSNYLRAAQAYILIFHVNRHVNNLRTFLGHQRTPSRGTIAAVNIARKVGKACVFFSRSSWMN